MKEPEEEKRESSIHHPEFIILTEEHSEQVYHESGSEQKSEFYQPFEKLEGIQATAGLRIGCLITSFLMLGCTVFVFLFLMFALILAALTFGQVESLNSMLKKYWSIFRKVFVITMGLTVAVFSPFFGLGLIILYFILFIRSEQDPIFSRFFSTGFYTK